MLRFLVPLCLLGLCSGSVIDIIPDIIGEIPLIGDILKNTGFLWRFYQEEGSDRSVEILNFTTPIGILKGEYCYIYGDIGIINALLKLVPFKKTVSSDEMDVLIERCSEIFEANIFKGSVIPKILTELPGGMFRRLFIFPGTRWCGAGDIARNYDTLGPAAETDKCCRDHDHCSDNIAALGSKHGLINTDLVTKSHCDCDNKFYQCLKTEDSVTSNAVGVMYFNFLSMQCFAEEHPLKCIKRQWFNLGKCEKYERDTSAPKSWQFIDPKNFIPGKKDENIDKIFKKY